MPESNGTYIPTLQFQPYVAPYTAQPVKEFQDFGELLNKRYDENISKYDKLDELMHQIQVSDADQHIKQGLLDDTRKAISGIVKDGSWENANTPVREVARRFVNDSIIAKASGNYQKAQKLKDEARQAEMNGKPQIQFKDIDNFSTVDPTTGKLRDLDVSGVYEDRLDYQKKMMDMFEGMHASGTANKTNNMMRDEDTGQLYQAGSGYSNSGITRQQVINSANRQFGSYLASSEGQQRLKVLTSKNSDNGVPVDHATALNLMKQELINSGLNKVFHETSSEQFTKPDRYNKGANPGGGNGTLINDISYQQNQNLDNLINALDKPTSFERAKMAGANKNQNVGTALSGLDVTTPMEKGDSQYKVIPKEQKQLYDNLFNIFSKQVGSKDRDKVDPQIKKYLNSVKNGKIQPLIDATNDTKDINNANNFFRNGAYESANYFDPETQEQLSWKQITDKYKNEDTGKAIGAKDADEAKVVGRYSPDNPFYDMTAGNADFALSRKVIVGGHSFVVGALPQDKATADYEGSHLASKISSSRRTGLPVNLSHGLTIMSAPNGGYLIKQGTGEYRGGADGNPLSLTDLVQFATTHGVKTE